MKSSPGFVTSSKDTKSISAVDSLSIPSVINVLVVEDTEVEYQYSSIESVIKVYVKSDMDSNIISLPLYSEAGTLTAQETIVELPSVDTDPVEETDVSSISSKVIVDMYDPSEVSKTNISVELAETEDLTSSDKVNFNGRENELLVELDEVKIYLDPDNTTEIESSV